MLCGEFIEQGFHFIEVLIESVHMLFEAGGVQAELPTGRAPGIHGMIGQHIHGQRPGLQQGPERGVGVGPASMALIAFS